MSFVLRPLPDYGSHITFEEWLESVECGGFIDYDGWGYYATENQMTDIIVRPSHVEKETLIPGWTHIVWFNK